jgi:hypothetical protein
VQVPARVDAKTRARLVLLHLIHVMPSDFVDRYGGAEDRVISFLRSASRPLGRRSLKCETCWEVARYYLLTAADEPPTGALVRKAVS